MALWAMILAAWQLTSLAADSDDVLREWMSAQADLHSWQADFTQTRAMKTLARPLVATGHVWFKPPNQFRWELGDPAQTIVIRSTNELFIVYPLLKRAERYPVGEKATGEWRAMLSLLEAGFPHDLAELQSRFRTLSVSNVNDTWVVKLQPANATARRVMKEIQLGVSTNNYSLASTEMIFVDGSSMRNDFTNTVLNSGFGEKVFHWKRPSDFKITEPLKQ
jgi:outer membrane lipoprotein-sorting protein